MKRCQLRLGPRNAKGLRPVYLAMGGRLVGYVCEIWGKGAGWFFRPLQGEWSTTPEKTMKAAILKIGESCER